MEFRTPVSPLAGRQGLVSHSTPLLLIGSCFAENIGRRLADALFDVTVNPFGPLYNPLSILAALRPDVASIHGEDSSVGGHTFHFMAHSRLSGSDFAATLAAVSAATATMQRAMRDARVVFVTLGTTRLFRLKASGQVVANCHKMPASMFAEQRLSLAETVDALSDIVEALRKTSAAPEKLQVVFTVSPVRYTAEGAHANQLAKSTLLLAVDEVVRRFPETASYFPAYEILMDDLRDYRFYADDMKHPSDLAVSYIYSLFARSYFDSATEEVARAAEAVTRRLAHRTAGPAPDIESVAAPLVARCPALANVLKNHKSL